MHKMLRVGLLSALVSIGLASGVSARDMDLQFSGGVYHKAVCGGRAVGLIMRCHARVVTDSKGTPLTSGGRQPISGYAPADLHSAYNITTSGSSSTIIAIRSPARSPAMRR